jgi:hypothetical protein
LKAFIPPVAGRAKIKLCFKLYGPVKQATKNFAELGLFLPGCFNLSGRHQ